MLRDTISSGPATDQTPPVVEAPDLRKCATIVQTGSPESAGMALLAPQLRTSRPRGGPLV